MLTIFSASASRPALDLKVVIYLINLAAAYKDSIRHQEEPQ